MACALATMTVYGLKDSPSQVVEVDGIIFITVKNRYDSS